MTTLFAGTALLEEGWCDNVRVTIGGDGRIASVETDASPEPDDIRLDDRILLPAPVNLHSHTFQRAMAGLTERRSQAGHDSFWTWRDMMYRFVSVLTPDHVEAITAMAQIEMLENGFGSEVEFHYLHNQPGGAPYADPAEMAGRIVSASDRTGIGLTLLPVFYAQGSASGAELAGGQLRFRSDVDSYETLWAGAERHLAAHAGPRPDDAIGIAPHSLRAASPDDIARLVAAHPTGPVHIHIAEQTGEVEEILAARNRTPVAWLCENFDVNERWCLIHATHTTPAEIGMMAERGAVAGLCPVTEANLGDGIFPAAPFVQLGGRMGVGTDSNVSIDLPRELRMLEYSQRLANRSRAVLAGRQKSVGRMIFDAACQGGAAAAGRDCGAIAASRFADLFTLDATALDLFDKAGDTILDGWIFAATQNLVTDTWSAGRHVVRDGRHVARNAIEQAYRRTMTELAALI